MEEKSNYYAIIPATVRYDEQLKCNEKFMYGEITALSNINDYCTAGNAYFANLYDVHKKTISAWLSNLQKHNYINIKLIRNEKQEVIKREIYINPIHQKMDTPIHNNEDTLSTKSGNTNSTSINKLTTTIKEIAESFNIENIDEEWHNFLSSYNNDKKTPEQQIKFWKQWCQQYDQYKKKNNTFKLPNEHEQKDYAWEFKKLQNNSNSIKDWIYQQYNIFDMTISEFQKNPIPGIGVTELEHPYFTNKKVSIFYKLGSSSEKLLNNYSEDLIDAEIVDSKDKSC